MIDFNRMNECANLLEKGQNTAIMTELLGYCNNYIDMVLTKWSFINEDEEDIKQELAIKVLKIFEGNKFKSNGKRMFSFYFDRVVRNYLNSLYKKSVSMHIPDAPIERLMDLPTTDNIEKEVSVKIIIEKLKKRATSKELKTMNLIESGFTFAEINRKYKKSSNYVNSQLNDFRAKLGKEFVEIK